MIAFYDPVTLEVTHTIHTYPENYVAFLLQDPKNVFHVLSTPLPHDRVLLNKDAAGVITVTSKLDMNMSAPLQVKINVPFTITGVPAGAVIVLAGSPVGIMDTSGTLDLTLGVAGSYTLKFTERAYLTKEITIEAIA